MYLNRFSKLSIFLFFLLAAIPQSFALSTLFEINGTEAGDGFGNSIDVIQDIDGDGISDIVVGSPKATVNGLTRAGKVEIFSGKDGNPLIKLQGFAGAFEYFGQTVAGLGDLNGDGYPEVAISSQYNTPTQAGRVYVISAYSKQVLFTKTGSSKGNLGHKVCNLGDIDGDGVSDILIGEDGWNSMTGAIRIVSGLTSKNITSKYGTASYYRYGWEVACLGDVSGDGIPDYAVGEPVADAGSNWAVGIAYVYSGANHSLLWKSSGVVQGGLLGLSISKAGDVNQDGIEDVALAAPSYLSSSGAKVSHLEVRSGIDGSLIYKVNSPASKKDFGIDMTPVGDYNGNGVPDLAVGTPLVNSNDGQVEILSGIDGTPLLLLAGSNKEYFGRSMTSADLDGDGLPELIVGGVALVDSQGSLTGKTKVVVFRLGSKGNPTPSPTPTPNPTATPAPAPPMSSSTLTTELDNAGALVFHIAHSGDVSACSFRLRAAPRESRIVAGSGRIVHSWTGNSNTDEHFSPRQVPRVRRKAKRIWFGLERSCNGEGWKSQNRSAANLGKIQNKLRPRRIKRIIRWIQKTTT